MTYDGHSDGDGGHSDGDSDNEEPSLVTFNQDSPALENGGRYEQTGMQNGGGGGGEEEARYVYIGTGTGTGTGRFFDLIAGEVLSDSSNQMTEVNVARVAVAEDEGKGPITCVVEIKSSYMEGNVQCSHTASSSPISLDSDPALYVGPAIQERAQSNLDEVLLLPAAPLMKLLVATSAPQQEPARSSIPPIDAMNMFAYNIRTGHLSLHDGNHRVAHAHATSTSKQVPVSGTRFRLNKCQRDEPGDGAMVVANEDDRKMTEALMKLLASSGTSFTISDAALFATTSTSALAASSTAAAATAPASDSSSDSDVEALPYSPPVSRGSSEPWKKLMTVEGDLHSVAVQEVLKETGKCHDPIYMRIVSSYIT